ncbi:MAG: DUF1800 domain-containing protein [Bacteroidota bacterium]
MASLTPLSGTLGTAKAAHLLRRATFGTKQAEIENFANMTVTQATNLLLTAPPAPTPPIDPSTNQTWVFTDNTTQGTYRLYLTAWWMHNMMQSQTSAVEKMIFFLHTHFTSKFSVVRISASVYHQLELFRHYAFGDWRKLTVKMTYDNAMLRFLDGRTNRKNSPNENYARELLELYSIGKGPQIGEGNYTNYTEDDVQAAARVLTGWNVDESYQTIDPETGLAAGRVRVNGAGIPNQHDIGDKQFSAAFQNTLIQGTNTEAGIRGEAEQLIHMIFNQTATAENICRKLYRFFVNYRITDEIEQDIIAPLAQTFITQNFQIKPVLEQLLQSEHFYDADDTTEGDHHFGALLKSPLELFTQTLNFFEIDLPDPATQLSAHYTSFSRGARHFLPAMGMIPYEPIETAGYPAYHQEPNFNRNWVSANTIAYRYKFIQNLQEGTQLVGGSLGYELDPLPYVENATYFQDISDPVLLVQDLAKYLFAIDLPVERMDYFTKDILVDGLDLGYWSQLWLDYQLTSDASEVRSRLKGLINAMLQTPEYQLG